MNFEQALKIVLIREGGYVNDPDDPGEETYKGVARKYNPNWPGWVIIDQAKKTKDIDRHLESNLLLQDQVKQLYYSKYWLPLKLESFTDNLLKLHLFDMTVNAGQSNAVKLLQSILQVEADGIIGTKTINSANNYIGIGQEYATARKIYYQNKVNANPVKKKYLKGWLNRVKEVTESV